MHYLMIENPGAAPLEGLLLQGATTKDPSKDDATIGMFGSGTKYSVLALLRGNIFPIITTGLNRLEWELRPILVGNTVHREVYVRINNKSPRSTGSVLASGQSDWKSDTQLALREFVSNALDETKSDTSLINFSIVSRPTARQGYTRVFVPWQADGMPSFQTFLKKFFLHYRQDDNVSPTESGPIPKAWPNSRAQFYRRGVLIRSFSRNEPSLWDYNFVNLNLDEARNADDWTMQYQASTLLANDPQALATTLNAITNDPTLWEAKLSQYGLEDGIRKHAPTLATLLPPDTLYADNPAAMQLATHKGIQTKLIPSSWYQALQSARLATVGSQLGEWITKGIDKQDRVDDTVRQRVNYFEAMIRSTGLASSKGPAPIYQFLQHPSAASKYFGLCQSDGIYLNKELGSEGELLDQTIFEELCHWHSGSKDFTREFQEWIIRFALRKGQR